MKLKFSQFEIGTRLEKSGPEPVHLAAILAAIFHTTALKYLAKIYTHFMVPSMNHDAPAHQTNLLK